MKKAVGQNTDLTDEDDKGITGLREVEITAPKAADVIAEVKKLIDDKDSQVTQSTVADQAGIAKSTLSQILSGNYNGNINRFIVKLSSWLEGLQRKKRQKLPKIPDYFETLTSSKVIAVLGHAHDTDDMAIIYSGAGRGKTMSLKFYRDLYPNVWMVTGGPASRGTRALLLLLAEACEIRLANQNTSKINQELIERLRGSGGLIIIDEAQHLNYDALEAIRHIHDQAEIGIVLAGNDTLYSRLIGGTRRAEFAQIFSRIGIHLELRHTKKADVTALAKQWGVSDAQRAPLDAIAKGHGGLRAATKTLRFASLLAVADDSVIKAPHITAAAEQLQLLQARL